MQAVETNLASKDSHWVYANEVRPNTNTLVCTRVNLDLSVSLPLSTQTLICCQDTQKHMKSYSTVTLCHFTFTYISSTSFVFIISWLPEGLGLCLILYIIALPLTIEKYLCNFK